MNTAPKFSLVSPGRPQNENAVHDAQVAVRRAIANGRLLRASCYPCASCTKPARYHHHCSYLPSDYLCVVPLCGRCHRRVHNSQLKLPHLGVVPTHVGMVRIAIAGLPS